MTLSHPTSGAFVNSTLISVEKSLKVIQGLKTIVDRQWMVAISTISWKGKQRTLRDAVTSAPQLLGIGHCT